MNPLQAAAVAGQLAGAACDMLLDWIAPLPDQKPWPDGEQPLIDEPPLTGDELVAVRQLIEERFDVALEETADHLASGLERINEVWAREPMPTWVGGSDGFNATPAVDDGTAAAGGAAPVDTSAAGAAHSKLTGSQLIAAAIGLREYAESDACETPTYWRNIADQLDPK